MGWFEKGKGEVDPKIENALAALNPREISTVTKTDAGFNVLKLIDKKGGELSSLEEQRASIRMKLRKRNLEKIAKGYFEKAGVKIYFNNYQQKQG